MRGPALLGLAAALLGGPAQNRAEAPPATRPAGGLLRAMQERAKDWEGMEAELVQREFVVQLEEPLVSRGTLLLDRKGNLRIEIREPRWSLLLARGERVEIYRRDRGKPEFSGVDPTGAATLLPLLGLSDDAAAARIEGRFVLSEEASGPSRTLRLRPRAESDPIARSLREARFEVGVADGLPRAFEWGSRSGDRTRYELASVRSLARVEPSRFERP